MTVDTATIIYVASCIGVIGAAVKILHSAKLALMKPLDDIREKLAEYDAFLENDNNRLEQIDGILADMKDSINMLIKSHRTVLYHLEEGNHSGEIRKEIEELDTWLIDRRIQNGR